VNRLPLIAVAAVLAIVIAVPVSAGLLGFGAGPSAAPPGTPLADASATPATDSFEPGPASQPPTAAPTPVPTPPEPTPIFADVAIEPVAHFRTTRTTTDREEVAAVLSGRSTRYEAVELVEADADAILAALDLDRPAAARS